MRHRSAVTTPNLTGENTETVPYRGLSARVAVDARMIRHSGIGVVLRGFLRTWARHPERIRPVLMGSPETIRKVLPEVEDMAVVRWNAPVYSASASLSPPRLPEDVGVWYSPHYATCLRVALPLVCHVQDVLHITHPTRPGTSFYNRVYLSILRQKASYVLTTSRHVKVQLQTLYGFRPERVLRTGVGPGLAGETAGENHRLPTVLEGVDYLVAVGIMKGHKNWEFMLRRLAGMGEKALPLACAGLGDRAEQLYEKARKLGVASKIRVLPYLKDGELAAVYRHARGLVFPSLAEGFGLPVLEAMSVGCPVLIADRSPMREIAGDAAYRFDPDYPESFDQALEEMLGNEETRRQRIAQGLEQSRTFSWERAGLHVEHALFRAMTGRLPKPVENGRTAS